MITEKCLEETDMFLHLWKSNYEVWDLGRQPDTGIYIDHVNIENINSQGWGQGHTDATGLGLAVECVAHELGFLSDDAFLERVLTTLTSLSGHNPDFNMPRSKNGWIPRFPNSKTGAYNGSTFEMMPSGLQTAGVLFAKTYTSKKFADSDNTSAKLIVQYAEEFYQSI